MANRLGRWAMYTQLFPILTNEVIIGARGMADATDDR